MSKERARYRIQWVAERTGVPEATLRAWERRYQVPVPARTPSGYRIYSAGDVEKVLRMRELCENGMAPSEAAQEVSVQPSTSAPGQSAASPSGEQKWVQVVGVEHVSADGNLSLSGALALMEEAAQAWLDERVRTPLRATSTGPMRVQRKVRLGELVNAISSMTMVNDQTLLVDVQLSVQASSGELSPFATGKLTFETYDASHESEAEQTSEGEPEDDA